jgi:hypothetical protein
MRRLIQILRALIELLKQFHADMSTGTPARRRTREREK